MSMFTRRHYRAIALAMQDTKPEPGFGTCEAERNRELDQWTYTCAILECMFDADNPRFNWDWFEQACAPGANVRKRT